MLWGDATCGRARSRAVTEPVLVAFEPPAASCYAARWRNVVLGMTPAQVRRALGAHRFKLAVARGTLTFDPLLWRLEERAPSAGPRPRPASCGGRACVVGGSSGVKVRAIGGAVRAPRRAEVPPCDAYDQQQASPGGSAKLAHSCFRFALRGACF